MNDRLFRALLSAYMCADPHPWSDEIDADLTAELQAESRRRGFDGWVDAFHTFKPEPVA